MFGDPLLEQHVRHAHRHDAPIVGHKPGRLEPGIEAVPVDLGLHPREDFVPNIAGIHTIRVVSPRNGTPEQGCEGQLAPKMASNRARRTFASEICRKTGPFNVRTTCFPAFSTGFSTGVENSGRRPNMLAAAGPPMRAARA